MAESENTRKPEQLNVLKEIEYSIKGLKEGGQHEEIVAKAYLLIEECRSLIAALNFSLLPTRLISKHLDNVKTSITQNKIRSNFLFAVATS